MKKQAKRQYSNNEWHVRKEHAAEITGFWHTIEFLNQPVFPKDSSDQQKTRRREEEYLLLSERPKPSKTLSMYHKLGCDSILNEMIKADDRQFIRHPEKGSKIHLCIGMLERRTLVQKMDDLLGIHEEEIEKDTGILTCFGLKINSSGQYIENSFNISPLLWGITVIHNFGQDAQKQITAAKYYNDLQIYENMLQKEQTITNHLLKDILDQINHDYSALLNLEDFSYRGAMIYNRYPNQKDFEKFDSKSEDFSDLSHGFFTKDLLMLTEAIENNQYGNNSLIQQTVLDYIISARNVEGMENSVLNQSSRIDIKNDKTGISKWLMPEKHPLGKWPSKYVPSLMQQIAINLQISEDPMKSPVFSVNGPPGTGKTTLLKEIIAHNLVERARLLLQFPTPDDAFDRCQFSDGKLKENGYDKCYYRYYKLKDERIYKYGMLVASCNNDAVENITTELPNGKDLLQSLKTDPENSEPENPVLSEIAQLFDLKEAKQQELYKIKKTCSDKTYRTETVQLPDIYFSWLAHRLCTGDEAMEKDFTEWGMISAPLGKRSNINKFCYHVLNPLLDEFLISNEKRRDRLENYKKCAEAFQEQLKLVESQSAELNASSKLEESYINKINKLKHDRKETELLSQQKRETIHWNKSKKGTNEAKLLEAERELQVVVEQLRLSEQAYQTLQAHLEKCEHSKTTFSDRIIAMEDSMKFFDHIYQLLGKQTEKIRRIQELKAEKEQIIKTENSLQEQITEKWNGIGQLKEKQQNYIDKINSIKKSINNLSKEIEEHESIYLNCQREKDQFKKDISDINAAIKAKLSEIRKRVEVLDFEFWDDFYSEDTEKSTKAQLVNPWIDEEFNRSREKLFYLALQLHKEFILSSTACRDNFMNLSMMWQSRNNTDDELVHYSKRDREIAFPELLNTLFLFTPVISTTFASIQTFLGDIKEPEKIGLLIVDEAGQAAPHMAAGALYRCKRAVIVGDPRQIQPVVTADSDHIKTIFSNDSLKPYLSKTISVQEFADQINLYGTYIKSEEENSKGTWVGCPLIVHRRCITPMFQISNQISYANSMKLKTAPPKAELESKFLYRKSLWFDIGGKEKDTQEKDHFVKEQGEQVCRMLAESFKKNNGLPDLFVISPFKSVISGLTRMLETWEELADYKDLLEDWCNDNCNTVHKFQGKEAAEVILLLGCDKNSPVAIRWVKSNIVNVAVTRAKYRIYVIGDRSVWQYSKYVRILNENLEMGEKKRRYL